MSLPVAEEQPVEGGIVRRRLRDLAGRALWTLGRTRPGRTGRDRLTVVTFHRVLTEASRRQYPYPGLAVTPGELGWFLEFFSRHYEPHTLAGALTRWQIGEAAERPLLAITFDDGQADNYEHARPVLEQAGLRATFFVPVEHVETGAPIWHDRLGFAVRRALERGAAPDADDLALAPNQRGGPARSVQALAAHAKTLDPTRREELIARYEALAGGPIRPSWDGMMSWDQLRELQRAGHEIGSHSLSHPILPRCADPELGREVAESKAILENRLQVEIASFCYPNGDHDARVVEAVRRAGYRQAVTTSGGPNRRGISLLELGRCDLVAENCASRDGRLSEARLAWRLSGSYPGSP